MNEQPSNVPANYPRVVFFDIETTPTLAYVWSRYEANAVAVEEEWHLLSFSYKVQGEKKAKTFGLDDFPLYQTEPDNDKELVAKLWEVINDADVVVAHNGDRFDLKKAFARFIFHGMPPPSPFKSIDTLKLAKKHFAFGSNKLNDLAQYLGIGQKVKTGGWELWAGCIAGNPKSWALMKRYNEMDVLLLEKVYEKFKPWATTHPRLSPYPNCGKCGGKVQRRGPAVSRTKGQQWRFQCTNPKCGSWETRVDKAA